MSKRDSAWGLAGDTAWLFGDTIWTAASCDSTWGP